MLLILFIHVNVRILHRPKLVIPLLVKHIFTYWRSYNVGGHIHVGSHANTPPLSVLIVVTLLAANYNVA